MLFSPLFLSFKPIIDVLESYKTRVILKRFRTEEAQQKALPTLDEEVASGYLTQLQRLAELSQSDTQVDLALLARLPGVFSFPAAEPENDEAKELMQAALDEALVEMVAMRTKEGQALAEDCAGGSRRSRRISRISPSWCRGPASRSRIGCAKRLRYYSNRVPSTRTAGQWKSR